MSGFPPPPNSNRTRPAPPNDALLRVGPVTPLKETALTDDETMFILKKYLRPDYLEDPKVIKFILAYLESRHASQAAEEAGFPRSKGSYLRARPEIHKAIEALTVKAVMKHGYDASEVIERVKEIGTLDPLEFENPDGSYKTHLSQISPQARRAIKSFTVKNMYGEDANGMKTVIGQLVKVELWDKLKSLEFLGREKNIFKETKKVEHDVTANMADVLLASQKRGEIASRTVTETIEITGRCESVPSEESLASAGDHSDQSGRD